MENGKKASLLCFSKPTIQKKRLKVTLTSCVSRACDILYFESVHCLVAVVSRPFIEKHSVIYRFPCSLRPLRRQYVEPVTRVRILHFIILIISGDGHAQLHNIKTKRRKMKLIGNYFPYITVLAQKKTSWDKIR